MQQIEKKAFNFSLILHGILFLIILGFWVASFFQSEPEEFVFEMVDLSQVQQPQPVAEPTPEPEPTPEREPVPEPEPEPEPVPEPEPELEPEPEPEPERISFDEHRREHRPPPPRPRPRPEPRPVEVAPIDVTEFTRTIRERASERPAVVQASPQAVSQSQQNELARYGARLSALANQRWRAPADALREVAEVEFRVSPDGRVTSARILRSSGSRAFDNSALEAVRGISGAGPTPTGQSHTFRIRMTMQEDG